MTMNEQTQMGEDGHVDLGNSMVQKFGQSVAGVERAQDWILIGGDKQRQARLVMKSRGPACRQGEEVLGQILPISDIYVTEATNVDPTSGIERQYPRTTIFDVDGNCWRFGSQYVFESVVQLIHAFGPPTVDKPWFVVPMKSKTKKGMQMIALTLPEPAELEEWVSARKVDSKKDDTKTAVGKVPTTEIAGKSPGIEKPKTVKSA